MENRKAIDVNDVLQLLDNGKTRKEIAEHYSISASECKELFEHPKLKGKRAKKPLSFVIVDREETIKESVNSEELKNKEEDLEIPTLADIGKAVEMGELDSPTKEDLPAEENVVDSVSNNTDETASEW